MQKTQIAMLAALLAIGLSSGAMAADGTRHSEHQAIKELQQERDAAKAAGNKEQRKQLHEQIKAKRDALKAEKASHTHHGSDQGTPETEPATTAPAQ